MSLISGVIAIFLSNRIMRKYNLPYLSSYFYFLLFLNIFSVYSVVGSQSIRFLLNNHGSSPETVLSATSFLIALGIPFLILAWYMFLRVSMEFFRKEIPKLLVLLYFLFFVLSFALYIVMNLNIGGMETLSFFMDSTQLIWTFTGLMLLIFGYALLTILVNLRTIKDINQRKAFRWFMLWYTIIPSLSLVFLHLSSLHIIFGLAFLIVLLGFHLVPVLFLNLYLQRFYVGTVEASDFKTKFAQAIKKHEISPREAEIIELICKGMSNQEISDSLYISLQTVKDHVHRIFIKTGVKNRVQLSNLIGK